MNLQKINLNQPYYQKKLAALLEKNGLGQDTLESAYGIFGDDGELAACGGDGVVSVVSNIAPALIKEFTSAALSDDFAAARQIYYRLLPLFKAAFIDGNPSSIKYAMSFKKIIKGGIRLPLTEVTDSAKKIIEDALKECGL